MKKIVVIAAPLVVLVLLWLTPAAGRTGVVLSGRILFTTGPSGHRSIFSVHPDGSGLTRLTNPKMSDGSPIADPSGSRIAFQCRGKRYADVGGADICIMNADGSDRVRLTRTNDLEDSPSWSPDGKKLAFSRVIHAPAGAGLSQLVVIDLVTGQETLLSPGPRVGSPEWSPDGSSILFLRADDIWITDPTGQDQRPLTATVAGESSPSWSPSGRSVVFSRYEDDGGVEGHYRLFELDVANGTERRFPIERDGLSARFSPDGEFLVIADLVNHSDFGVFIAPVSGEWVRRLVYPGYGPSWSS